MSGSVSGQSEPVLLAGKRLLCGRGKLVGLWPTLLDTTDTLVTVAHTVVLYTGSSMIHDTRLIMVLPHGIKRLYSVHTQDCFLYLVYLVY